MSASQQQSPFSVEHSTGCSEFSFGSTASSDTTIRAEGVQQPPIPTTTTSAFDPNVTGVNAFGGDTLALRSTASSAFGGPQQQASSSHAELHTRRRCAQPTQANAGISSVQETLTELLSLQRASGEFVWGPALERALGMTRAEALRMSSRSIPGEAWVTILALAFLQECMAGEKELWELVAEKASAFASTRCPGDVVTEMMEHAKMIVKRNNSL